MEWHIRDKSFGAVIVVRPLNPFFFFVRVDDLIATAANSIVLSFAKREVWLSIVLRSVTALASFLWIVTALLAVLSGYSQTEKFVVLLLSLAVAAGEFRLCRSHTLLVKRGWTSEVFALYREAAAKARVVFLPFRIVCLASLLVLFVQFYLSHAPTTLEVHAIIMTVFYCGKFYLERVTPPSSQDIAEDIFQKAGVHA